MTVDLTKLILHSGYAAFKNNQTYTGSVTISGSTAAGLNTQTFTIPLINETDIVDIIFNGQNDYDGSYGDPRPSSGWFKEGAVYVRGDNAGAGYVNYSTRWVINSRISGTNIIITALWTQTFTDALTLASTSFSYKLVDYSVF